jgi:N-acetylglucosaminyldiphosphoundecaprenol N-acetyl-beta-D-mannosaminyltransferase
MQNWNRIDARIALTGGAAFDYISGELRRGPRFLTDNGFEWLARLLIEPRRLWRRYVVGNPLFLLRVLKQRLLKGGT